MRESTIGLDVECCDPRDCEGDIKSLFARNGKPEFEAIFEHAYRARAESGLKSWIGRQHGRAVTHISVTPMRFGDGRSSLVGGVLGDLMVEPSLRDFWTPVRMLRSVLADLKRNGSIDFLITTTTSEAESVFKACGFRQFAQLWRYVIPLAAPYLAIARLRARASGSISGTSASLTGAALDTALASQSSGARWRPLTSAEFYATRTGRARFAEGEWVRFPTKDGNAGLVLITRDPIRHEIEIADAFWSSDSPGFEDVVLAAGRWSREKGFRKLTMSTLFESGVGEQLKSAGFFPRAFRSNLLVQKIRETPPPVSEWFLTGFPLSGW